MPLRTTRALIDRARAFHLELSEVYGKLEEQSDQLKVKRLLELMKRHERCLEHGLKDLEDVLDSDVLNTWFQNTPEESHWHGLGKVAFKPDMSMQEVVAMVFAADQALVNVYHEIAGFAVASKVRDVFEALARSAEDDRDQFADLVQDYQL